MEIVLKEDCKAGDKINENGEIVSDSPKLHVGSIIHFITEADNHNYQLIYVDGNIHLLFLKDYTISFSISRFCEVKHDSKGYYMYEKDLPYVEYSYEVIERR